MAEASVKFAKALVARDEATHIAEDARSDLEVVKLEATIVSRQAEAIGLPLIASTTTAATTPQATTDDLESGQVAVDAGAKKRGGFAARMGGGGGKKKPPKAKVANSDLHARAHADESGRHGKRRSGRSPPPRARRRAQR